MIQVILYFSFQIYKEFFTNRLGITNKKTAFKFILNLNARFEIPTDDKFGGGVCLELICGIVSLCLLD